MKGQNYRRNVIRCSRALKDHGWNICFAESASSGKLAYEFSRTEFSGSVFKGSIVCYDAQVKIEVVGIEQELIDRFTAESAEVTKHLALKVREMMKATVCVGLTGLLTPGGSETPEKPVGTIFFCIALGSETIEVRKVYEGTPEKKINSAIVDITHTILDYLRTR